MVYQEDVMIHFKKESSSIESLKLKKHPEFTTWKRTTTIPAMCNNMLIHVVWIPFQSKEFAVKRQEVHLYIQHVVYSVRSI